MPDCRSVASSGRDCRHDCCGLDIILTYANNVHSCWILNLTGVTSRHCICSCMGLGSKYCSQASPLYLLQQLDPILRHGRPCGNRKFPTRANQTLVQCCTSLWCSAHLVNCAFDQTRSAADQFINCAAFDELRNIWSIVQHTCNRVRVNVRC